MMYTKLIETIEQFTHVRSCFSGKLVRLFAKLAIQRHTSKLLTNLHYLNGKKLIAKQNSTYSSQGCQLILVTVLVFFTNHTLQTNKQPNLTVGQNTV